MRGADIMSRRDTDAVGVSIDITKVKLINDHIWTKEEAKAAKEAYLKRLRERKAMSADEDTEKKEEE